MVSLAYFECRMTQMFMLNVKESGVFVFGKLKVLRCNFEEEVKF